MAVLYKDYSLLRHNTFGFDVYADFFFTYSSSSELIDFIKEGRLKSKTFFVLGKGSNILFISDYRGLILYSEILGINKVEETKEYVIVEAGAGVEWDILVRWSVDNNFYGIENLSAIPGSVGASPVQNIGAYGVELKDVFYKAKGVYIETGEEFIISAPDCRFDYRYSIFKGPLKGKVIITSVLFKLAKSSEFKLGYGSVMDEVHKMGGPTLQNIRKAITEIRNSKLPLPEKLGNAGSFFKNPVLNINEFDPILKTFPDLPFYQTNNPDYRKIPAGWLIEKAGWKGKSIGNAGVHSQQALVLVNLGGAKGSEILELARQISYSVNEIFGINLEMEVNVI